MAPPDQGSGASPAEPPPAPAPAAPCSCAHGGDDGREPAAQHERKLSSSCSLSSHAAASPSSSYASALPASAKLSYDSLPSIAGPELANLSSSSSVSSYESFFHIDAPGHDDRFLDFDPATRPPLVQTTMHRADGAAAAAYDPKRLPSSMFRTKSTSPAEWSVNSNESLFSIQLSRSHSGELYSDLYYDAAGVPRFPSLKLPSLSEASMASGGLCMRDDCTRCTGSDRVRKSVRFAAKAETASGEIKHSPVYPSSTAGAPEGAAESGTKAPEAADGWCVFGCCSPAPPTMWWPRCCAWHCCDCRC